MLKGERVSLQGRREALFLAGLIVLVSAMVIRPLPASSNPDPVSSYYEYATTVINGTALNSTDNLDADDEVYYTVDCDTSTITQSETLTYNGTVEAGTWADIPNVDADDGTSAYATKKNDKFWIEMDDLTIPGTISSVIVKADLWKDADDTGGPEFEIGFSTDGTTSVEQSTTFEVTTSEATYQWDITQWMDNLTEIDNLRLECKSLDTGKPEVGRWDNEYLRAEVTLTVAVSEINIEYVSQQVAEPLANITQILVEDNFKFNTTVTAQLEWYNWTVNTWAIINTGSVGPTEVTWSKTWTSGFGDVINSSGYMKVRIYTSDESNPHRLLEDYLHWDVTYVVVDTTPPEWSNAGTNNTIAGQPTLFHVKWTDNVGLSGFIFGTNNMGTWTNDTWTLMSGTIDWSNVTKTLNSTVGIVVQWRVWANDTFNNWNDTGILSLTTTVGYALNLCVKDWDLVDSISGAYVCKDLDVKVSDANGWANWTGVSGTVFIKVKWYGAWVNGTFSIVVDSDKTIDVQCNIFDIVVTTIEGLQNAVLQYVNVTVYNGTSVPGNRIRTGITNSSGMVYLANVPNSTLTFTCYDEASPQHVIANVTRTIVTENQAETIICDQNYITATYSWSIIGTYSSSFYLGFVLLPEFCLLCVRCLKERVKTIRSKQNKRRGGKKNT